MELSAQMMFKALHPTKKTKKDFEIDVTYQDQECRYRIDHSKGDKILKFDYKRWTYNLFNCDSKEDAESHGISQSNLYLLAKPSGSIFCYAVYTTEEVPVGRYSDTSVRSVMDVSVNAGSSSGTVRLDTELGITQRAISNFAYVVWNGFVSTGQVCEGTTDMPYRPAYRNSQLVNIDKSRWEDYDNYLDSDFRIGFLGELLENPLLDRINEINRRADVAMVSQKFGTFDNPSSFSSGILTTELGFPVELPILTFYVKSSTSGIYTPVPEIKITDIHSECFISGTGWIIEVEAENIGDEGGSVRFFGECQGGVFNVQSL